MFLNGGIEFNVNAIVERMKDKAENAFINAGRRLVPIVQKRIHEDGLKSDGSQIGEYTEYTKKIRRAKGLQTSYVDLVFDSILLDSQQFEGSKETVKLTVTDDGRAIILANLESKYGKITGLTDDEREEFLRLFEEEYNI